VVVALSAIICGGAHAADVPPKTSAQVENYRPVFQACRKTDGTTRLAIRRLQFNGAGMVLTVDPHSLTTRLDPEQDFTCADTGKDQQQDTRYIRALRTYDAAAPQRVVANGGILHGSSSGAFITADLCPSHRALDRAFLQNLLVVQSPLPVALSISGTWLTRHQADFQWLRALQSSGTLQITWVDHSYHHPYVPGRALAQNFLLSPGVDARAEILDTEKLLIARGEIPSVFFRFPGLISSPALMRLASDLHLIVLGAGAWLAQSPRARPGDIILIHANGNEPLGLAIFSALLDRGKLPRPFRAIEEAP
jgi:hypothetical protein